MGRADGARRGPPRRDARGRSGRRSPVQGSRDLAHRREGRRGRRLGVARTHRGLRRLVRPARIAKTCGSRRRAGALERSTVSEKDAVLVEPAGSGVTKITLNRPARLNAMNYELVAGLYEAFDSLT